MDQEEPNSYSFGESIGTEHLGTEPPDEEDDEEGYSPPHSTPSTAPSETTSAPPRDETIYARIGFNRRRASLVGDSIPTFLQSREPENTSSTARIAPVDRRASFDHSSVSLNSSAFRPQRRSSIFQPVVGVRSMDIKEVQEKESLSDHKLSKTPKERVGRRDKSDSHIETGGVDHLIYSVSTTSPKFSAASSKAESVFIPHVHIMEPSTDILPRLDFSETSSASTSAGTILLHGPSNPVPGGTNESRSVGQSNKSSPNHLSTGTIPRGSENVTDKVIRRPSLQRSSTFKRGRLLSEGSPWMEDNGKLENIQKSAGGNTTGAGSIISNGGSIVAGGPSGALGALERSLSFNNNEESLAAVAAALESTRPREPVDPKATLELLPDEYAQNISEFRQWQFRAIPYTHRFLLVWKGLMFLVNVLQIILCPLILGWSDLILDQGIQIPLLFFFIDLSILVDIFIHCTCELHDEYGTLVTTVSWIQRDYLVRKFGFIKLFGGLPLDFLVFAPCIGSSTMCLVFPFCSSSEYGSLRCSPIDIWAMWRFAKMFLILPYGEFFRMTIPGISLQIARLLKAMILLIVLGHLDACVFWCIERYLPAGSRWIDQKNLVTDPETLEPVTMASQYFVSIIGSLESLVLDLRQVSEPREYVAVLFEFMFGILAYGTVFGTITNVLHMADSAATMAQQEEQHKYEIKGMKEYMWDKGIRPELQEKVLSYKELQWRRIQGLNECDLFADLPKNLQQQIQDSLYLDLVKQVPLFQEMDPAILSMIAYCITPLVVMDKWFVYEAGDEAAEMYFIKAGSIEILAGDTCIGLLEPGNFFGETALWGGEETGRSARRITSARAVSGDVELCVLANEDFEILQESFPELKKRIQDLIDVRDRRAQEKLEEDRLRAESEQLMASHSPLKHQKTKKPRPLTDILKRINPGGSTDQLHQNSGVHTSSPVSPVSHDFQSIMHLGSPLASVSEPQSDAQTSHGHNSPSQSGGTIAGQPVSSMPPIPYPAYAQTSAGRESIASSSAKERELALSREQLASREHPIARENTATGRSLRTRTQSLIGPRHAGDRSK